MKLRQAPECCRLCKFVESAPREKPCCECDWDRELQQGTEFKELDK